MRRNLLFAAPLAAALMLSTSSAFAQPNPPITTAQTGLAPLDNANWRAVTVKNVRPSLIAYQLDPEHNKLPEFFNLPYMGLPKYTTETKPEKREKGPFDVPENVSLAAADDQKLLFVTGADTQQMAQLQRLVDILDQPLRLVELEAQMVELPVAEVEQFGLSTDAATPGAPGNTAPVKGAFQVGFVRENFQTRINDLVAAGTARVSSTKPQTITNNIGLAVSLRSGPLDNTGANQNRPPAAPANGNDTIITLTPTINGDDTITVLMRLTALPENINPSGLVTIANIRDGQTIALTGLKSSAFPTQPMPIPLLSEIPLISKAISSKKMAEERAVLVFVTGRIVR